MRLSKKRSLIIRVDERNDNPVNEENIEETLKWYDKQIQKNPKDTGLYYAKAALLAKEGMYEESIATLDKIIELDPDNQKVWYIKANTLFELEMYEQAISCFDRILEFAKDDERVWYHKGEALSKLERYKKAIECYDKAIQLDRNFTEAWLGRGNALRKLRSDDMVEEPENLDEERKEELDRALENFEVVTDQNPFYEEAWQGKGFVLHNLGRYEEALPCYDRSIEIKPDYIGGWYGRGKTLKKLERDDEAIQSFENAIGFAPEGLLMKDLEEWGARANSFYELGRYEEALDCFDKILEKYPDNTYALEGKGAMLEKLGRKEESLQCYRDAINKNSGNASTLYRAGALLSDSGDYRKAMECYNEAVEKSPGFEEAWFRLGELLSKQNEYEKAKQCFSRIITINPNNEWARRALLTISERKNECNGYHMIASGDQDDVMEEEASGIEMDHIMESIGPGEEILVKGAPNTDIELRKGLLAIKERPGAHLLELQKPELQKIVSIGSPTPDIDTFKEKEISVENIMIRGKRHLHKGEFNEALWCLNKVLEIDPKCEDAWSVKGDVLLKMGKFDDATSCYKKAMILSLELWKNNGHDGTALIEPVNDEYMNTLISFIDDDRQVMSESDKPCFDCPNCGSLVYLEEKLCQGCNTIFFEEEFKNSDNNIDDDLVFFDRLQEILTSKNPLFIYLDNTTGFISYLEKRENRTTGKADYFIVKGKIEKISWNYSFKREEPC